MEKYQIAKLSFSWISFYFSPKNIYRQTKIESMIANKNMAAYETILYNRQWGSIHY